jgi:hypothetical protein
MVKGRWARQDGATLEFVPLVGYAEYRGEEVVSEWGT